MRTPKSQAELLRFVYGIPSLTRRIEEDISTLQQNLARCSDALSDFEDTLKIIGRTKDGKAASLARRILKKHRIK